MGTASASTYSSIVLDNRMFFFNESCTCWNRAREINSNSRGTSVLYSFKFVEPSLIIHPAKNILGAIRLPGDKSISHRYAMLAGLAQGATRLANFSTGADCASTVSCMKQLGCNIQHTEDGM